MKQLVAAFLIANCSVSAFAQVVSVAAGDWDNHLIWDPPVVPDNTSGTITVNHSVTVPNGFSVSVDQVTIQASGSLTIDNGGVVSVVDGSGTDLQLISDAQLQVSGILECSQGATIAGTTVANTVFNPGGRYRHLYTSTEGRIPTATWQSGSTLEIAGYNTTIVASSSGNWSQPFANVVFNCNALNNKTVSFQGLLNNMENLTIQSTGSVGSLILTRGQTATIDISGNLTVSGSSRFYGTSNGNVTINIGNDFIYSSTNVYGSVTAESGISSINIGRDFIMNASGGLLKVADNVGLGLGQTTMNIGRNFQLLAGILAEGAAGGQGIINFIQPGMHIFQSNGRILNTFHYYVGTSATLDLGTSALTGDGTFTLDGTIIVRSTASSGAISNSTTAGNIRLPLAQRFYNSGSTIIYGGASGQIISSGHPSGSGIAVVFDNPSGVWLVNDIVFGGNVTLQAGNLNMGVYNITMNGPNWLTNGGALNSGTSGNVTFNSSTNVGGTSLPSFRNIIVSSSGAITLTNHVNVLGNLTIQSGGAFNTSTFELRLTGNSNQNISANGSSINRITINKTGGSVILNSQLYLTGTLQFISNTNLITNDFLTLRSTDDQPAADGNIAALPLGALITGNVTVERYFQDADDVDRFISSPISNASVAQLQDDFPVTGNFTGTSFPCTGCKNNGASLRRYDETVINSSFKSGYVPVPASGGSNSELLVPGVGYDAWMWNGVSATVLDVTGTINRGTINFTLSHTPSTPPIPTDDGWNLVGNPYPSAIQWNNGSGWSRSNVDPTVWVWDVVARVWRSYNYNTGIGTLSNGIIALGQAFWVYVPNPGTASMSVNEAAKSTAGSGSYYRTTENPTLPYVKLKIEGGGSDDEAYVLLHPDATPDYDYGIDAFKLITGQERISLGLKVNNSIYNSYAINSPKESISLPLQLNAEEGVYRISIADFGFSKPLYLIDRLLQETIRLDRAKPYEFRYTGEHVNRFVLTDRPLWNIAEDGQRKVEVYPNPATHFIKALNVQQVKSVQIISLNGVEQTLRQITYSDNSLTLDVQHLNPGTYILRIHTASGISVQKFVVRKQ